MYCLGLLLAFDFAYSTITRGEEKDRPARIANAIYDHGFAADFDGYDVWGELRYRLITDSLGFKDASARKVPLKSASRRILLIGDSFAEGIGVSFEDSFAGQLYRAGQERSEKIEFLNASVASYSPSIYYKKIKYWQPVHVPGDGKTSALIGANAPTGSRFRHSAAFVQPVKKSPGCRIAADAFNPCALPAGPRC